jgi:hypothetical protein
MNTLLPRARYSRSPRRRSSVIVSPPAAAASSRGGFATGTETAARRRGWDDAFGSGSRAAARLPCGSQARTSSPAFVTACLVWRWVLGRSRGRRRPASNRCAKAPRARSSTVTPGSVAAKAPVWGIARGAARPYLWERVPPLAWCHTERPSCRGAFRPSLARRSRSTEARGLLPSRRPPLRASPNKRRSASRANGTAAAARRHARKQTGRDRRE